MKYHHGARNELFGIEVGMLTVNRVDSQKGRAVTKFFEANGYIGAGPPDGKS